VLNASFLARLTTYLYGRYNR